MVGEVCADTAQGLAGQQPLVGADYWLCENILRLTAKSNILALCTADVLFSVPRAVLLIRPSDYVFLIGLHNESIVCQFE